MMTEVDLEAEALVDTVANTLSGVEAETRLKRQGRRHLASH